MTTATIRFAPNATGTVAQTLVVNSDDPTLPLEDLNVVGIGK
jgi:hypothetical protein